MARKKQNFSPRFIEGKITVGDFSKFSDQDENFWPTPLAIPDFTPKNV